MAWNFFVYKMALPLYEKQKSIYEVGFTKKFQKK